MDPQLISSAIVVFIGQEIGPVPGPGQERVTEAFGPSLGKELNEIIDRLEAEFYEVVPRPDESLNDACDRAVAVFSSRHSEISQDALNAFRWRYSYDFK